MAKTQIKTAGKKLSQAQQKHLDNLILTRNALIKKYMLKDKTDLERLETSKQIFATESLVKGSYPHQYASIGMTNEFFTRPIKTVSNMLSIDIEDDYKTYITDLNSRIATFNTSQTGVKNKFMFDSLPKWSLYLDYYAKLAEPTYSEVNSIWRNLYNKPFVQVQLQRAYTMLDIMKSSLEDMNRLIQPSDKIVYDKSYTDGNIQFAMALQKSFNAIINRNFSFYDLTNNPRKEADLEYVLRAKAFIEEAKQLNSGKILNQTNFNKFAKDIQSIETSITKSGATASREEILARYEKENGPWNSLKDKIASDARNAYIARAIEDGDQNVVQLAYRKPTDTEISEGANPAIRISYLSRYPTDQNGEAIYPNPVFTDAQIDNIVSPGVEIKFKAAKEAYVTEQFLDHPKLTQTELATRAFNFHIAQVIQFENRNKPIGSPEALNAFSLFQKAQQGAFYKHPITLNEVNEQQRRFNRSVDVDSKSQGGGNYSEEYVTKVNEVLDERRAVATANAGKLLSDQGEQEINLTADEVNAQLVSKSNEVIKHQNNIASIKDSIDKRNIWFTTFLPVNPTAQDIADYNRIKPLYASDMHNFTELYVTEQQALINSKNDLLQTIIASGANTPKTSFLLTQRNDLIQRRVFGENLDEQEAHDINEQVNSISTMLANHNSIFAENGAQGSYSSATIYQAISTYLNNENPIQAEFYQYNKQHFLNSYPLAQNDIVSSAFAFNKSVSTLLDKADNGKIWGGNWLDQNQYRTKLQFSLRNIDKVINIVEEINTIKSNLGINVSEDTKWFLKHLGQHLETVSEPLTSFESVVSSEYASLNINYVVLSRLELFLKLTDNKNDLTHANYKKWFDNNYAPQFRAIKIEANISDLEAIDRLQTYMLAEKAIMNSSISDFEKNLQINAAWKTATLNENPSADISAQFSVEPSVHPSASSSAPHSSQPSAAVSAQHSRRPSSENSETLSLFHVSSKKHSKTTNKPAEHKTIDPALMSKEASNDEVKLLNEIKNYKSKLISDKVAHIDLVKSIANKNVQLQTELAKPLSEQKPHGADDLNEMLLADTEALNMLKDSIDQGEAQLKAANLQLHELNPQKYSVNGKTKAELKSELETLDNTIQKVKDAADKRFNDIQTTKDGYNELAKEDNDENFEALKELDNGITEAQEDYDELSSQLQDLQNKFDELRAEYESVNDVLEEDAKIEDIEKENNLRDQAKELKIEMININNQISVANESLSSFVQTFEEELKKSDDEKDQVKIETLSKEITDRENEINYLRNALKDTAAKRDNVSKELRAISKKTAKLSKDKPAKSAKSLFDEIGEQLPKAPQEIESSLELSGENILINKPNESEIVHDLHELKMESEATEIPLSNKQTYIELPDMSEESWDSEEFQTLKDNEFTKLADLKNVTGKKQDLHEIKKTETKLTYINEQYQKHETIKANKRFNEEKERAELENKISMETKIQDITNEIINVNQKVELMQIEVATTRADYETELSKNKKERDPSKVILLKETLALKENNYNALVNQSNELASIKTQLENEYNDKYVPNDEKIAKQLTHYNNILTKYKDEIIIANNEIAVLKEAPLTNEIDQKIKKLEFNVAEIRNEMKAVEHIIAKITNDNHLDTAEASTKENLQNDKEINYQTAIEHYNAQQIELVNHLKDKQNELQQAHIDGNNAKISILEPQCEALEKEIQNIERTKVEIIDQYEFDLEQEKALLNEKAEFDAYIKNLDEQLQAVSFEIESTQNELQSIQKEFDNEMRKKETKQDLVKVQNLADRIGRANVAITGLNETLVNIGQQKSNAQKQWKENHAAKDNTPVIEVLSNKEKADKIKVFEIMIEDLNIALQKALKEENEINAEGYAEQSKDNNEKDKDKLGHLASLLQEKKAEIELIQNKLIDVTNEMNTLRNGEILTEKPIEVKSKAALEIEKKSLIDSYDDTRNQLVSLNKNKEAPDYDEHKTVLEKRLASLHTQILSINKQLGVEKPVAKDFGALMEEADNASNPIKGNYMRLEAIELELKNLVVKRNNNELDLKTYNDNVDILNNLYQTIVNDIERIKIEIEANTFEEKLLKLNENEDLRARQELQLSLITKEIESLKIKQGSNPNEAERLENRINNLINMYNDINNNPVNAPKAPEKELEIEEIKAPEKELEIEEIKAPEKELEIEEIKAPEKELEIEEIKAPEKELEIEGDDLQLDQEAHAIFVQMQLGYANLKKEKDRLLRSINTENLKYSKNLTYDNMKDATPALKAKKTQFKKNRAELNALTNKWAPVSSRNPNPESVIIKEIKESLIKEKQSNLITPNSQDESMDLNALITKATNEIEDPILRSEKHLALISEEMDRIKAEQKAGNITKKAFRIAMNQLITMNDSIKDYMNKLLEAKIEKENEEHKAKDNSNLFPESERANLKAQFELDIAKLKKEEKDLKAELKAQGKASFNSATADLQARWGQHLKDNETQKAMIAKWGFTDEELIQNFENVNEMAKLQDLQAKEGNPNIGEQLNHDAKLLKELKESLIAEKKAQGQTWFKDTTPELQSKWDQYGEAWDEHARLVNLYGYAKVTKYDYVNNPQFVPENANEILKAQKTQTENDAIEKEQKAQYDKAKALYDEEQADIKAKAEYEEQQRANFEREQALYDEEQAELRAKEIEDQKDQHSEEDLEHTPPKLEQENSYDNQSSVDDSQKKTISITL